MLKKIKNFIYNKLNNRVKKTNWYRNIIPDIENYPGDAWYRKHLERNYDAVNLGSSSAVYAFNYSTAGVKAFNWALQPQSMEYSYKVLRQYYSIIKKNGAVIIPLSPFSGLDVKGKWQETANDKYFHILDSTMIDNYQAVAYRRNHPLRAYPKYSIKRLFNDEPKRGKYCCHKCYKESDFEENAAWWIDLWCKEFNIDRLDSPITETNKAGMQNRISLLSEIIDFCLVRNLRPILTIPPIHTSLSKKFSTKFCKNYIYSFVEAANAKKVEFYDFMKDDRFSEDSLFNNAYFLNEEGAKLFTEILIKQLQNKQI